MTARLAGWLSTVALLVANLGEAADTAKPNILFILADDYGWANLGVHRRGGSKQGQLETHTPNLDKLIDEGVLLDRHYAFRICSPSRSSLQTGRLALHVNSVNTGVTVTNASDPVSGAAGIPRNMTGIAQKLKQGGYKTHMVGKWDAGMATPEHTPQGRGYDTWVGYFQHANDYWRKDMSLQSTGEIDNCLNSFMDLFVQNETYCGGGKDSISMSKQCLQDPSADPACYEEELFKLRALQVIKEHDVSSPLFLFYAFHLLHTPLQVHDSYLKKIDDIVAAGGGDKIDSQNRKLYAAMTLYMDEAVGEVVAALKARNMFDNTLIVFSSDNGGPIYTPGSANNHPLRGGKYSDWEGGVRVNAFVSGGFVPQEKRGTVYSGVLSIADWYGTFSKLAGVDPTDTAAEKANEWLKTQGLPLLPPVDSVFAWDFIMNGTNARPVLQISESALLRYPYKLILGEQPYARWVGEVYPNCTSIHFAEADGGPAFHDLKLFDHSVKMALRDSEQQRLVWADDCGDTGCLFNVEQDPNEHVDLAADPKFAQTLEEMKGELAAMNKKNFAPGRGETQLKACEMGVDNGGYYGPFVDVDNFYTPLPPRTPGEYEKDEKLKMLMKVASNDALEKGLVTATQVAMPFLRDSWFKSLDTCLNERHDDTDGDSFSGILFA